jgi:DNA-binding MarR family transcriptional regulator
MAKVHDSRSAAVATRVWRQLFDFIILTANQRNEVLGKHGLTPNDSRALFVLGRERSMSELAQAWGCDASNATWIVDRLEKKGLAKRGVLRGDRRVKLVALTARGAKTREAVARALYRPPP